MANLNSSGTYNPLPLNIREWGEGNFSAECENQETYFLSFELLKYSIYRKKFVMKTSDSFDFYVCSAFFSVNVAIAHHRSIIVL
jgi:hypothetical protein